jgi:hypothetical protein
VGRCCGVKNLEPSPSGTAIPSEGFNFWQAGVFF